MKKLTLTKEQKIAQFDPSAPGNETLGIYGLPFTVEESEVVLIEVPWAVTVSSGGGTENGPKRIMDASLQVDIFNSANPDAWKQGIALVEAPDGLFASGLSLRKFAKKHIDAVARGKSDLASVMLVNKGCEKMVTYVEETAAKYLAQGKIVGLIGGDHSTPLGFINAVCKKHKGEEIGILHIDAHFDLRKAYEGFTYSHASVMYNALTQNKKLQLMSVGIRDYCKEEYVFANKQQPRVKSWTDKYIARQKFLGESWERIVESIISPLPKNIYISFDIDGLKQFYCPKTGTPVPGGLEYDEAIYLIERVCKERTIVGFDVNEVGDGEWDGNVGARLLFEMICMITAKK